MTNEEQLRDYAKTLGCSMRDLRNLVNNVYIDDENLAKRRNEAMQHQVNAKQLRALDLRTSVDALEYELARYKLNRIMRRINRWEKIKSLVIRKPKAIENPNDSQGR